MDIFDALRLIAAKSPNNVQGAARALRTAQQRPDSRPVQYILEQALRDPIADFMPAERSAIAALLNGDATRNQELRLRVNADEKAVVQAAAEAEGLSVSDYIRHRIGL